MSSPEAFLKHRIETATAATAWPLVPQEGASLPFVVYSRDGTDRPIQTSGLAGIAESTFTLEVCGNPWTSARATADAIISSLQNFTGTGQGAIIDHVHVSEDRDGTPVYLDGQDMPYYYVIELQLFIRWSE